jgi:hypothetical protein
VGTFALNRCALSIGAAAALTACSGSQPPIGAASVMSQNRASATHIARGGSWMLPEAKSENLLYVSFGCDGTCVLSYPNGELVGSLSAGYEGVCSDSSGDIFITNGSTVVEYVHGGTSPIATLSVPGDMASGCASDPTTGDLAVTYSGTSHGNVAIFQGAQGTPTTYYVDLDVQFCGYDNQGNLFVDGAADGVVKLAELPKGGSSFGEIAISPAVDGFPWQVQWDGKYITLEASGPGDGVAIYRLQIAGSVATVVGKTDFKGVTRTASQSWIQGSTVFIPYGVRGDGIDKPRIGVWKYPKGGKPTESFKNVAGKLVDFQGVTFSAASSR